MWLAGYAAMPMPTFPLARLSGFRAELYACLTRRPDALFELGDALLCAQAIQQLLLTARRSPRNPPPAPCHQ